MIVCRIESHKCPCPVQGQSKDGEIMGAGPYGTRGLGDLMFDIGNGATHPVPTLPGEPWHVVFPGTNWYFGFSSLVKMERWFPKEIWAKAAARGFSIAFYSLPPGEVLVGERQVSFNAHAAELVGRWPLVEE